MCRCNLNTYKRAAKNKKKTGYVSAYNHITHIYSHSASVLVLQRKKPFCRASSMAAEPLLRTPPGGGSQAGLDLEEGVYPPSHTHTSFSKLLGPESKQLPAPWSDTTPIYSYCFNLLLFTPNTLF
jgi:hypothetical protein